MIKTKSLPGAVISVESNPIGNGFVTRRRTTLKVTNSLLANNLCNRAMIDREFKLAQFVGI